MLEIPDWSVVWGAEVSLDEGNVPVDGAIDGQCIMVRCFMKAANTETLESAKLRHKVPLLVTDASGIGMCFLV